MSKTVLITGASSGIGEATAQYFLRQGWNVAATLQSRPMSGSSSLPPHHWTNAAQVIRPYLDVTDEQAIAQAVQATVETFGTIDVLVNNAGYGLTGPLEGISSDQLNHQFETNVLGLVAVIQKVLPIMRQQRQGTIINISSIGGRMAFPFASAYHATKFAVEGLSESLRFELKQHGIRVKVVEPGGIKTDFITRSQRWATHPAYEPELSHMIEMTKRLNGNLPGPAGVAQVIYRAATDGTGRLRYPAQPGPYLWMHSILPDRIWRSVVALALNRQAR